MRAVERPRVGVSGGRAGLQANSHADIALEKGRDLIRTLYKATDQLLILKWMVYLDA